MTLNKHAVLAHLLYSIANYEKGGCDSSKWFWSKRYKERLRRSLTHIWLLADSLAHSEVLPSDPELILRTIAAMRHFWPADKAIVEAWNLGGCKLMPMDAAEGLFDEVNDLIKAIVERALIVLNKTNRSAKRDMWWIIHSIHNLPRAYFCSQKIWLDGVRWWPRTHLSCKDALKHARGDLENVYPLTRLSK